MTNEGISKLSASVLRTVLITEIQEFIHSIDMGLPVDRLTAKRDYIKEIIRSLSIKEGTEFYRLFGEYFSDLDAAGQSEGQVA